MNRLDKMVRSNREGIRRSALSLLDKHNGGVGNGAPDEPGPCSCEQCERARKWLSYALTGVLHKRTDRPALAGPRTERESASNPQGPSAPSSRQSADNESRRDGGSA